MRANEFAVAGERDSADLSDESQTTSVKFIQRTYRVRVNIAYLYLLEGYPISDQVNNANNINY